jgi:uncharacterized secreted protein with C-terminal beta-propeller domain
MKPSKREIKAEDAESPKCDPKKETPKKEERLVALFQAEVDDLLGDEIREKIRISEEFDLKEKEIEGDKTINDDEKKKKLKTLREERDLKIGIVASDETADEVERKDRLARAKVKKPKQECPLMTTTFG